jgi:hypothetical protein
VVAFFFFHLGPEHMPLQPVGLLCYPCTILMFIRRSYFRRQSVSSSVRPKRPLVMKDGTVWARNIAGNFCLKCRLPRYILGIFTSPPKEGVLRVFALKSPESAHICMLCRMRLCRILQSMQHTQSDTKERKLLKCVVAVKECIFKH